MILLCMITFFCVLQPGSKKSYAATGEELYFDTEGNLIMTTYDRKATTSVTYVTIGWTIKRNSGPIPGNESVRVKLEACRPEEIDPNNPAYVYTYFLISKDIIFEKISSVSMEWAEDLYRNGGYVYLDGIMTVKDNGNQRGSMTESGSFSGEVYTDYEGIANARRWKNKEALRSHFDKVIYFPGNPELLDGSSTLKEPVWEEKTERISVSSKELLAENKMNIFSAEYNVERAIPSSEPVTVGGELQKYYYDIVYEHHYGNVTFPVKAEVTYTLIWDDGTKHSETVTVPKTCEVQKSYSYWKIAELDLHYLDRVTVQNAALPNGSCEIAAGYQPQIDLVTDRESYILLPENTVTLDGGIIDGGNQRPDTKNLPLNENKIGKIIVKNDELSIDGEIILSGKEAEGETEAPQTSAVGSTLKLQKEGLKIPAGVHNQNFTSTGVAEYKSYRTGSSVASAIEKINPVCVHTPVFCVGVVSDEIAFNQQVVPTKRKSLILGRKLEITVATAGQHIAELGYGNRDYRKYVKERQVCFPFPVLYGEEQISENTWITLKSDSLSFVLPVSVAEGDYDIKFRCIAINAEKPYKEQQKANTDRTKDVAYSLIPVRVVGRLSDFQITNVIDYPRWQNVFWNEDKTERTQTVYYAGTNDRDKNPVRASDSIYLVPLLKGSHPFSKEIHAPGLGYRLEFSLQTIGSMRKEKDFIQMEPVYYYVDLEGKNRKQVRLYQKEDLSPIHLPIILTAEHRTIQKEGVQQWKGSYRLPADLYLVDADIDLKEYIRKKGGRIRTEDAVFLKDGYLIVYFDITTYENGSPNLSYENTENAAAGYCDMWNVEGFRIQRTDSDGTEFSLKEGEVFVFDLQKTLLDDYESIGTH